MTFKFVLIVASFSLPVSVALSGELTYFSQKIDFWNAPQSSKSDSPLASRPERKGNQSEMAFPWKTFSDPKNKEFFKEGDYTPPEPFMEVARNPTDENIKEWFDLMRKKNEVATRLQEKIREYLNKEEGKKAGVKTVSVIETETPERISQKSIDPTRFKLRMFYDSNCPHCKRMFEVLRAFSAERYTVEAVQVNGGPILDEARPFYAGRASVFELRRHDVKSVPVLVIADTKRKVLLPKIEGFHAHPEIEEFMKKASEL